MRISDPFDSPQPIISVTSKTSSKINFIIGKTHPSGITAPLGIVGAAIDSKLQTASFAGMVGTNEALHDGWFIGYNTKKVFAIWIGSEKGKHRLANTEEDLRKKVASLWKSIITSRKLDFELDCQEDFSMPSGISFAPLNVRNLDERSRLVPIRIGSKIQENQETKF